MASRVTANCEAAAAAMGSMTIGAAYMATSKDPAGTPGVLRMDEDGFTFTPNDPRSVMQLNVDFRSIRCHRFGSKQGRSLLKLCRGPGEGGDYIFEFNNVADRDIYMSRLSSSRDSARRIWSFGQEAGVLESKYQKELQKLHMKFVIGKVLQESEFWATRKNLLDDEAKKASKQRPGFKSAMLDVRLFTVRTTQSDFPSYY